MDLSFRKGLQPTANPTNACPECSADLASVPYPGFPALTIRACTACNGVLLRDGDLAKLAHHLGGTSDLADDAQSEPPVVSAPASHSLFDTPDLTDTADMPVVEGRALPDFKHADGFFDKLGLGWAFIKNAYAFAWQHKRLMLPIVYGGALSLVFWLLNAAVFFAVVGGDVASIKPFVDAHKEILAAWSLAVVFAQMVVHYGSMGMCVNMIDAQLKGLSPTLSTAFQDVLKNIGGIVALAIVGTIVELITSGRNRRRRSLAYDMLAGVLDSFWTVASFLLLPVIMVEDVGLAAGLRRATTIHKSNLLQIAVGEVGINTIQGVLGFAIGAVLFGLGAALVPFGTAGIVVVALIAIVVLVALGAFNIFVKATYYTCLYLWASQIEKAAPENVIVPGPLADTLAI